MDDFSAHAGSNTFLTAALPIFDTLFASFDGRLPQLFWSIFALRTPAPACAWC